MKPNLKNRDSNSVELNKLLSLILSFMKFSILCSPQEKKFESVNNIFSLALELSNKQKLKMNEESVNKIGLLLIEALNNGVNIFKMNDFVQLMNFLNYKNKKNLGLQLIETLIEECDKENPTLVKIDSLDSLDNVLKFILPLLGDRRDSNMRMKYQLMNMNKVLLVN